MIEKDKNYIITNGGILLRNEKVLFMQLHIYVNHLQIQFFWGKGGTHIEILAEILYWNHISFNGNLQK